MRRLLTLAVIVAGLARPVPGHAIIIYTPSLRPPAAGTLLCSVVNLTDRALDIRARVLDQVGADVTDSLFTRWADEEGTVLVEYGAGSVDDRASYCRVQVRGGGRHSVRVTLRALDAHGAVVAEITAR